jgi:endonuclease YncB( thermonuclease family)
MPPNPLRYTSIALALGCVVLAPTAFATDVTGRASVSNGWALDWPRYSGGAYAAAESDAKRLKRGVWGSEFAPPWEWRRENSGGGTERR